ncbi:tubulin/FtsZ family, GTPase domain protein (macronuclear) [Tetrahymena thermophila SB210]|uniref:Tubulin beta chain n=1 Tax=Tetrahymena thermophila (strain SB210) TaxID=312017 RepID=Q24D62_TETTS|nr:tubulin/FtsZ family, GTPase domain protein [Tetrahymena thermophila SB210]EAS05727.1 tubulin/FtsZ family, GTPase domain protein [Tetrahymena thermophila SB210]|eukprot:XP_001025972.1 tubulin/FtsZ family, GTPase domain protein [Tetrahymena thermophila SB210]
MREIINLQIGQGGNKIGQCFWESLCTEHQLDQDGYSDKMSDFQREQIGVYFDEQNDKRYKARSLLIDGDPNSIFQIQQSSFGNLFNSNCFIQDQWSAANCFGKGRQFYELIDLVMDQIRILVEKSDQMQGFQVMRSLGGGTGSGLGDVLLSKLREEYPNQIITNFCIFPSSQISDCVVEPYNCVLSLPGLLQNQDLCFCYDNKSLYNILKNFIGKNTKEYKDLNQIIKICMSGTTAQWRFPSQVYNTMRKLATNMVPFPQLLFLNTGVAPILHHEFVTNRSLSTKEMISMLQNNRNSVNHNINQDKLIDFASLYIFRGINQSEQEILEEIQDQQIKTQYYIPDNQKVYQCNQTFNNEFRNSALKLENGTSVTEILQEQLQNFSALFKRKAFLHYGFGDTDEMEFTEAQSYLNDILDLYNQHQESVYDNQYSLKDQENQTDQKDTFQEISNQFVSIDFLY